VAALGGTGGNPAALLLAADRALYAAEAAGRRRVASWNEERISVSEAEAEPVAAG